MSSWRLPSRRGPTDEAKYREGKRYFSQARLGGGYAQTRFPERKQWLRTSRRPVIDRFLIEQEKQGFDLNWRPNLKAQLRSHFTQQYPFTNPDDITALLDQVAYSPEFLANQRELEIAEEKRLWRQEQEAMALQENFDDTYQEGDMDDPDDEQYAVIGSRDSLARATAPINTAMAKYEEDEYERLTNRAESPLTKFVREYVVSPEDQVTTEGNNIVVYNSTSGANTTGDPFKTPQNTTPPGQPFGVGVPIGQTDDGVIMLHGALPGNPFADAGSPTVVYPSIPGVNTPEPIIVGGLGQKTDNILFASRYIIFILCHYAQVSSVLLKAL